MRKLKITELHRITPEAFKQTEKIPLVVVLDNVRSLHNVGSVFRTSDAFRVAAVYLCGITATPPQAEIHKTALGAEDSVDWKYFENTLEAVRELKAAGFHVAAVEQAENSVSLEHWGDSRLRGNDSPCHCGRDPQSQKYAIVLGNEVHGVDQDVMNACDSCIEIPQFGTKHSLNVSVTAGIVIWTLFLKLTLAISKK
ncbi:MAG: RNA methyltransferase [Candidatus Symbiothrix sp.]|jgi:tRNA G18 (ribose-2'-O)-methylase SpoU|nr:RNA methyltransferase [Candidatus Symbiothrix sp.]